VGIIHKFFSKKCPEVGWNRYHTQILSFVWQIHRFAV
jgi:hypothetical protein